MNLFTILRQLAATRPDAIATQSPRRTVTYRKLWSRIERAGARLTGEWQVQPGQRVAYWGRGHQDAIVLYLGAARCGIKLLPLEHAHLQNDRVLQALPVALLLHDDMLQFAAPPAAPIVTPLSPLIATRCPYPSIATDDPAQPGLVRVLRNEGGCIEASESSMDDLSQFLVSDLNPRVQGALFDADRFERFILPALAAGGVIHFD